MKVLAKTPGLYQVPKLRNATTTTATTTTTTTNTNTNTTTTTTTTTTWVPWGDPGGGPRENPRSLSSPKAEKIEFEFLGEFFLPTDRRTDRRRGLYYPLGRG